MPKEHAPKHRFSRDVFSLTEQEKRDYRMSSRRFLDILNAPETTVHQVRIDHNSFGEYVFVTLSREESGQRYPLTCYGLGYHEYREQWVTDTWYWYEPHPIDRLCREEMSKAEVHAQLAVRRDEIEAEKTDYPPSESAILFGLIADLTDEDGAYSELQDLQNLGWLKDEVDADE